LDTITTTFSLESLFDPARNADCLNCELRGERTDGAKGVCQLVFGGGGSPKANWTGHGSLLGRWGGPVGLGAMPQGTGRGSRVVLAAGWTIRGGPENWWVVRCLTGGGLVLTGSNGARRR